MAAVSCVTVARDSLPLDATFGASRVWYEREYRSSPMADAAAQGLQLCNAVTAGSVP